MYSWNLATLFEPTDISDVDGSEVAEYRCKNLPPKNVVYVRRANCLNHYLGAELVQRQAWFTENSMSDTMVMENINLRNPGGLVLVLSQSKNLIRAEDVIGFAFSWAATADRKGPRDTYIFSNLVGVLPSFQGHNFATILKFEQRRLYKQWWDSPDFVGRSGSKKEMLWTVYPALAGNHHLNFDCLGARCNSFYRNLYGPIEGGLYGGLPTDRLEMTWDLDSPQVLQIDGTPASLLDYVENDTPAPTRLFTSAGFSREALYQASFPHNFLSLKTERFDLAQAWQNAIAEVIEGMFEQGFYIGGFKRNKDYGNFIFIPLS